MRSASRAEKRIPQSWRRESELKADHLQPCCFGLNFGLRIQVFPAFWQDRHSSGPAIQTVGEGSRACSERTGGESGEGAVRRWQRAAVHLMAAAAGPTRQQFLPLGFGAKRGRRRLDQAVGRTNLPPGDSAYGGARRCSKGLRRLCSSCRSLSRALAWASGDISNSSREKLSNGIWV
jgi:hypothetical protein